MAEEVGLTINDVELTFLGAPNQVTAFETKAIDAAYAVEPWVPALQNAESPCVFAPRIK